MNYTVCDEHGDRITCGLPAHTARQTAQRIANRRAQTVYLYLESTDWRQEDGPPDCEAFDPRLDH